METRSASDVVGEAEPVQSIGARLKRVGKIIMDVLPVLVGIISDMFDSTSAVIFASAWFCIAATLISVIVDGIHCRNRWAQDLPARWPKMPGVAMFILYSVNLMLLYAGVMSIETYSKWSGCFVTGGIAIGAAVSLLIGKPFVYDYAVEVVSVEKIKHFKINAEANANFQKIMRVLTIVWMLVFLAFICCGVGSALAKSAGQTTMAFLLGTIAPIVIGVVTTRYISPRVVEKMVPAPPADAANVSSAGQPAANDSLQSPLTA